MKGESLRFRDERGRFVSISGARRGSYLTREVIGVSGKKVESADLTFQVSRASRRLYGTLQTAAPKHIGLEREFKIKPLGFSRTLKDPENRVDMKAAIKEARIKGADRVTLSYRFKHKGKVIEASTTRAIKGNYENLLKTLARDLKRNIFEKGFTLSNKMGGRHLISSNINLTLSFMSA
jgi:hypothetical protein